MAHHHKVSGLVPAVVESMVVDVTEDGTSSDPRETAMVHVGKGSSIDIGNTRQVIRTNSKSDAVVKQQRSFVVFKTTKNVKGHFKSFTVPLYHSLVTSPNIVL